MAKRIEMSDIRFPAIGKDYPFVVKLDGKIFAGFNTYEEAKAARDMWATNVVTAKRTPSSNSLKDWRVEKRSDKI